MHQGCKEDQVTCQKQLFPERSDVDQESSNYSQKRRTSCGEPLEESKKIIDERSSLAGIVQEPSIYMLSSSGSEKDDDDENNVISQ